MTTATARPYTGADVPQGIPEVWLKAALPSAGAAIVLHSDGSLDALTNTSAVFLGKVTADGVRWSYKPRMNSAMSAESPASFRDLIEAEEVIISGTWIQTRSADLLAEMMVGGTKTTPTGSKLVTVGGLRIPPTFSVVLVYEQPEAAGKYDTVQIYKTLNESGVETVIAPNKPGQSGFQFRGQIVSSRAKGDQLMALNFAT